MTRRYYPHERIILDLCGGTGAWSAPYRKAGYDVRVIDPIAYMQGPALGRDVRRFKHLRQRVHGVLCAPPCTDFSRSGARWWDVKGDRALIKSLAVVDACCRIVLLHKPRWWVLENPLGRLSQYLGPPVHVFQPCDYGDHFTKKTALWGDFNRPFAKPVKPTHGSLMAAMGDAKGRARRRSITPPGFAQAFFEANP